MQIQIDSREHKSEAERIKGQFDKLGVEYFTSKLYVGDYMSLDNPRLIIDRKKDLMELCGNVTQQHERFRRELLRAQDAKINMIILCEHGSGITCLEDVLFWKNPRYKEYKWVTSNGQPRRVPIPPNKRAINGDKLFKLLQTIRGRYGVRFVFCNKDETGAKIVELLR